MYEGFLLRQEFKDEAKKADRLARLEELENQIFERASAVVNAALSFVEIDPNATDPPQSWIDEYGEEVARQRLKVAQSLWLPASVVPAGFKLASQAMTGISRGRAYKVRITQNTMNVKLTLPAPTTNEHPGATVYEVRDLEK